MLIRSANLADIPSIMSMERESATAGHWSKEQYRRAFELGTPRRIVLVAEAKPEVVPDTEANHGSELVLVGFLVALQVSPEWELENIVVSPSARRTGVGNQLLSALFEAACTTSSEIKSEAVFLEVRESNMAARAFYEKAGFVPTGRRKAYYTGPTEDALIYRMSLS